MKPDYARKLAQKAVRDGILIRQSCEACPDDPIPRYYSKQVEAHHDDYDKPLDVRWLCIAHHRRAHGRFKDQEWRKRKPLMQQVREAR